MSEPNASPPGHRPVDRLPVDLARTSVFIDFDGTITLADTGVHVLERLALPGWRDAATRTAAARS